MEDYPIEFCSLVAKISTLFEWNNTELKRQYLVNSINKINDIMKDIPGFKGSFGTGYPFYVLDENLEGHLPVIEEQIRYNNELANLAHSSGYDKWVCAKCLIENYDEMPDLKTKCIPCDRMCNELKPRKVINRLPDLDMWLVCDDKYAVQAEGLLSEAFKENNIYPSDLDPIRSINDVTVINSDLLESRMPEKLLPLDIHIIKYSTLLDLIKEIPDTLKDELDNNRKPYMPIHPRSLRKVWQFDDTPYNFIYDFLLHFTDFNFEPELKRELDESRMKVALLLKEEELVEVLDKSSGEVSIRRFQTPGLAMLYRRRINRWKEK